MADINLGMIKHYINFWKSNEQKENVGLVKGNHISFFSECLQDVKVFKIPGGNEDNKFSDEGKIFNKFTKVEKLLTPLKYLKCFPNKKGIKELYLNITNEDDDDDDENGENET